MGLTTLKMRLSNLRRLQTDPPLHDLEGSRSFSSVALSEFHFRIEQSLRFLIFGATWRTRYVAIFVSRADFSTSTATPLHVKPSAAANAMPEIAIAGPPPRRGSSLTKTDQGAPGNGSTAVRQDVEDVKVRKHYFKSVGLL